MNLVIRPILVLLLLGISLDSCLLYSEHEKYVRPDWAGEKLYTQVTKEEDLTLFAECLRIVGLDTILDVSGSFTIFAPSDDAVNQFLFENHYPSVSEIPEDILDEIVEFHIIQNPWTLLQLRQLGISGWVDPSDQGSVPNAYKRQTLLKDPADKFWIKKHYNSEIITLDSTAADFYRKVYVQSRKYIPIYFDEFFDIFNLSPEDYSYFFDRPYTTGSVFYAGAKVTRSDIFAENGFIHVIDRVVKPMLNGKELLEREIPGESYKQFLDLVYRYYPEFEYNKQATESQPGFTIGWMIDSLYNLRFPDLAFDIHQELSRRPYSETKYTLVYHNGMHVPTDEAFGRFVDGILTSKSGFPHWADLNAVPEDVIHNIVDHHFFNYPLYQSTITKGFRDGQRYRYYLDEESIIRKEFGSNCTFLGLDEYPVPRLFTSITGTIFLRPAFSNFRLAVRSANLDRTLSRSGRNYAFFPITNAALVEEQSLMIEWIDREADDYRFLAFDYSEDSEVTISTGELRNKILNQVGTELPNGSAKKEFIRTIRGNYIIWNNEENTVSGSKPSTFGHNGIEIIKSYPVPLEEPTDNGKAWWVNSWFNFVDREMFSALYGYPAFFDLLDKVGLINRATASFPFLDEDGYYTIFIPSAQALGEFKADTLPDEVLANFLQYHFVKDALIFTDNKMPSGQYNTLAKIEGLTPYYSLPAKINIGLEPDLISILDSAENPYITLPEAEGVTNNLVTHNGRVTAVIHEIDRVLIPEHQ